MKIIETNTKSFNVYELSSLVYIMESSLIRNKNAYNLAMSYSTNLVGKMNTEKLRKNLSYFESPFNVFFLCFTTIPITVFTSEVSYFLVSL